MRARAPRWQCVGSLLIVTYRHCLLRARAPRWQRKVTVKNMGEVDTWLLDPFSVCMPASSYSSSQTSFADDQVGAWFVGGCAWEGAGVGMRVYACDCVRAGVCLSCFHLP